MKNKGKKKGAIFWWRCTVVSWWTDRGGQIISLCAAHQNQSGPHYTVCGVFPSSLGPDDAQNYLLWRRRAKKGGKSSFFERLQSTTDWLSIFCRFTEVKTKAQARSQLDSSLITTSAPSPTYKSITDWITGNLKLFINKLCAQHRQSKDVTFAQATDVKQGVIFLRVGCCGEAECVETPGRLPLTTPGGFVKPHHIIR